MILLISFGLLVCANGDLVEPKFQVLTPSELMVEVPHHGAMKLVTFRMGVRRKGHDLEDVEFGENEIDDHRIFIYDQRLNLREGDLINYLLAFRGKEGYQTFSGKYKFDGVYYKKSYGRRHRFRRHLTSTTPPKPQKFEYNPDETEEFEPTEPRFGGGNPHHGGRWPPSGHGGFNPWGGPRRPPYPVFPPPHGHNPGFGPPDFRPPDFGDDCNNHRHDMCHGRDTQRWVESSTSSSSSSTPHFHSVEYHCGICRSLSTGENEVTTVKTRSTTREDPDIDIRFGNQD